MHIKVQKHWSPCFFNNYLSRASQAPGSMQCWEMNEIQMNENDMVPNPVEVTIWWRRYEINK